MDDTVDGLIDKSVDMTAIGNIGCIGALQLTTHGVTVRYTVNDSRYIQKLFHVGGSSRAQL